MSERVVVIGGNAAGMTAASRARRVDPRLKITILEASQFISYSICGAPSLISGEVSDLNQLITFTPERLASERDIEAHTGVRVEEIMPARRRMNCRRTDGETFEVEYDQAVIATGYRPLLPKIEGAAGLCDVFTVSRLEDGLKIRQLLDEGRYRRAAIIGGGYVGLMMAHALRTRGLEVVLVERNRHVFSQIDDAMAEVVESELVHQGVELRLQSRVQALEGADGRFRVVRLDREVIESDLCLIDVGVGPNVQLAVQSGIPLGMSGAIEVDERGSTMVGGIYAAGNCAETRDRVSGKPIFSALGTTAARQGRVVGENIAGLRSTFPGSLETSIERVFDMSVSRTGLTLRQAQAQGFEASLVTVKARDRAAYQPRSQTVHVALVFEKRCGRVLGGQMVTRSSAAKRIDTVATAIIGGLTLRDLSQLDLAYAPPLGTLWDPIQIAANVALRQL